MSKKGREIFLDEEEIGRSQAEIPGIKNFAEAKKRFKEIQNQIRQLEAEARPLIPVVGPWEMQGADRYVRKHMRGMVEISIRKKGDNWIVEAEALEKPVIAKGLEEAKEIADKRMKQLYKVYDE